jgi:uncharacterized protein (TIGR04141 family)
MAQLTIYLLTPNIKWVAEADVAIAKPASERPVEDPEAPVRLFVTETEPGTPPWAGLVESLAAERVVIEPRPAVSAAVLVGTTDSEGSPRVVAFAFGSGGRFVFNRRYFVRGFGLRACLNACFPDGARRESLTRLRSVDSRTLVDVPLATRRLASRAVEFDAFGMNVDRDLLRGAQGRPHETARWGTNIRGSDSLQITVPDDKSLIEVAADVLALHDATDYRTHFSFIDDIKLVADDETLTQLEEATATAAQALNLDLVGPEGMNFDEVAYYWISGDALRNKRMTLSLQDYRDRHGGREPITLARLRSERVVARNASGDEIASDHVLDCLVGQLELDGKTYVLAEGMFYEVSRDYLKALNRFIDNVLGNYGSLPPGLATDTEPAYLDRVGATADALLVHPTTIPVERRTEGVEPCDLCMRDGALVYVKKKEGSAKLSHLLNQGTVATALILGEDGFRAGVRALLSDREGERRAADATFTLGFAERFDTWPRDGWGVVYAIVGRWRTGALSRNLPFFTKVALRQHAEELRRMGVNVAVARVPTTSARTRPVT